MIPTLVVVVLLLSIVAWYFSAHQVTKRRLRKFPIRTLAEGCGGKSRVTGSIDEVGLHLSTPFSGRRCAWYRVTVLEKRGKNSWAEVAREERSSDFMLTDATGTARVVMMRPRVASVADYGERSGIFTDATPVEEGFLSRHGYNSVGFFGFNRTLRYLECALAAGEVVTVLGHIRKSNDGSAPYEIVACDDEPLTLSDDAAVVRG